MRWLFVLVLVAAGCAHTRSPLGGLAQEPALTANDIREAKRIVVIQGSWSLDRGSKRQWVIESGGKCSLETSTLAVENATFVLPPESFSEVQRALLSSKIWTLKQGRQGFIFESGGSFSVDCDGHKHDIWWGIPPKECEALLQCIERFDQRIRDRQDLPPIQGFFQVDKTN